MRVETFPDRDLHRSENFEDNSVDFGTCKKLPSSRAPSGGLAVPRVSGPLRPKPTDSWRVGRAGCWQCWPVTCGGPACLLLQAGRPGDPNMVTGGQRGSCWVQGTHAASLALPGSATWNLGLACSVVPVSHGHGLSSTVKAGVWLGLCG